MAASPTEAAEEESRLSALPDWALETLAAVLRGSEEKRFAEAVEAARNERLFGTTEGDEAWYAAFPLVQRAKARDLTTPELWQPVDEAAVEAIFAEGGELAKCFGRYEPRAGQVAMAHAVAQALNRRTFLLAEAGTGVGKSLAYLVPCALWACANNLPIVISTNTRNLQTQLLTKDLPLVRQIVARHIPKGVALDAVVLKGRGNYLCLKRFGACVEGGFERFSAAEALNFADLVVWAAQTRDGDLDAFRPVHGRGDMAFVRSFGCRADTCTGKKCRFFRRCFLQKARQAALQAHLVIANHALVFAELDNPGTLLPPHAQIVFDEAHNLESAATEFLSAELSPYTLYEFCQRLAPSKGREAGSLLQQARTEFIDLSVPAPSEKVELIALLADLRQCGVALAKAGTALFETLHAFVKASPESAVRFRSRPDAGKPPLPNGQPQLRREICLNGHAFIPAEEVVPERDIAERKDAINQQLTAAGKCLERLLGAIARKAPPAGQDNPYEDLVAATEAVQAGLKDFGEVLEGILSGGDPAQVYWMSRTAPTENTVALTAAPLDISRQLARLLYDSKETLVFSSATLRIRHSFEHIQRRLGLNLVEPKTRIQEFVATSPFNYPAQCCVAVPDFLPEVGAGETYTLELSRMMYLLFVAAQGRSLVLFTSYEMMSACAKILEPHLADKGIDLLVQSPSLGRDAMTEAFRAQRRPTVLFGTQSFWEGVDVVGSALSCVIIARLPFESVGDPLLKARCEQIEAAGGSAFAELSVPQAVIRFRQGFGRLIRSRADRGLVIVADSRIVRKSYGRTFSDSLPVSVEVFSRRDALMRRFRALLERP